MVNIPYYGKCLDLYRTIREENLFFGIFDAFGGNNSEQEELEAFENSFKKCTHDRKVFKKVRW